jgi:hypothetical protein
MVEIADDIENLPFSGLFLHKTKTEAIKSHTSYYGHPCDDPRKRGAVCEVSVTIKIPAMPQLSKELLEYIAQFEGSPVMRVIGNAQWNASAERSAKVEQRRKLKKLRSDFKP